MPSSEEPNHVDTTNSVDQEEDPVDVKESPTTEQHNSGGGALRKRNWKNAVWICERCSNLGLSVDRFLINGSHSAERSQYLTKGSSTTFSPKLANSKYPLGTYEEIASRRAHCKFCDLVVQSIGNAEEVETAKSEEQRRARCFVTWEIDGRSAGSYRAPVKARTRRLHLQWEDGLFEDAYLVLVTQGRHSLINSDARHMWQADAHFLARKVSPDASRATLIKSWLDDCLKNHGRKCLHSKREKDAFQEVIDQSYFGVIDVEQMCLTTLPRNRAFVVKRYKTEDNDSHSNTHSKESVSKESFEEKLHDALDNWEQGEVGEDTHKPYVALSYVWGGNNAEKTVHDNVLTRLLHGGLEEPLKKMPKVIKDAIELVRRLGYRYLWIDALCIVQNSSRSWKLNAEVMNMIYGNADLTICAADGIDATAGLQALSKPTHSQIIVECVPGLRLMVSRLAEASIKKSKWNTRGWTFQERLLSRRCLIFTEGRVMFQCRSAAMSEDIVTAPGSADNNSKWSLDLLQSPLKLLNSLTTRPIWFYMNCIQLYSARDLTKPGDVLAAFNGVSNHIEDALSAPLAFGLPTSHFDLALLWAPLGASQRRMGDEVSPEEERLDDEPARRRHSRYKQHMRETNFPSWSWCGWQGCSMDYLTNSMVDDCLDDVNEWLARHTWIQWHIRDGRGRLRPLWNAAFAKEARFSEHRWQGYRAEQGCEGEPSSDSDSDDGVASRRGGVVRPNMLRANVNRDRSWQPYDVLDDRKAEGERRERAIMGEMRIVRERERMEKRYQEDDGMRRREMIIERPRPSERPYDEPYGRRPASTTDDTSRSAAAMSRTVTTTDAAGRDQYGRRVGPLHHPGEKVHFQRTIPESPYKVNMTDYCPDKDREYPDSPILQFWTHSALLRLYPYSDQEDFSDDVDRDRWGKKKKKHNDGLVRFNITDVSNDWCGSILLSETWVEAEEARQRNTGLGWDSAQYEFLALSEAKRFTEEECGAWTYYLPLERRQSEWDLYFVLLTEKRNGTWSRVALGKVFSTAFENGMGGSSEWKEIVLV